MTSSELPSDLPEQPSQKLAQAFDYIALENEARIVVQQCTTEIKSLMRSTALNRIEIGQKLIDVKERLRHGEFGKWLKVEFSWGWTTAWKLMRVAETFKFSHCENLDIAPSAFYLLTDASTPEQAREEVLERARSGETITPSIAEAIISKYKESSDTNMASTPVTIDIPAESVEKADPLPTKAEPIEYTERNQPSTDENASASEVVQDNPDDADQSEQELLGKEIQAESALPEISKPDLTRQLGKSNEPTGTGNKGEKKMERQQVNEIYKNLRTNINYIAQENIFEEIDLEDLKSLEEEITLLVKRKEASLNKHYNSNYSNN